ncbi:MAG TPA: hypothetical protein PKJ45_10305 [Rubrivivax sp.]|nr:hypothetical protein [Rubrivivax sp.]
MNNSLDSEWERVQRPVIPLQPSDFYEAAFSRSELLAAECAPGTARSTKVHISRRWWRGPEWVTICVDWLQHDRDSGPARTTGFAAVVKTLERRAFATRPGTLEQQLAACQRELFQELLRQFGKRELRTRLGRTLCRMGERLQGSAA